MVVGEMSDIAPKEKPVCTPFHNNNSSQCWVAADGGLDNIVQPPPENS